MGKYSKKVKTEYIIDEQTAVNQFMLFVDYYDMDVDEIAEAITKKSKNKEKTTGDEIGDEYVEMIRLGKFTIFEEDGIVKIKQHLVKSIGKSGDFTEIVYGQLRGKNRKDMGMAGSNDQEVKSIALLNSLSSTAGDIVEKLIGSDYSTAIGIAGLYFLTQA